ncbi:hypothetical protein F4811DRAFT_535391 [Daldinia bambusicola]|nr:hypothetical protein F4811DRAFT_535391 [Daldinia bambusicola]
MTDSVALWLLAGLASSFHVPCRVYIMEFRVNGKRKFSPSPGPIRFAVACLLNKEGETPQTYKEPMERIDNLSYDSSRDIYHQKAIACLSL